MRHVKFWKKKKKKEKKKEERKRRFTFERECSNRLRKLDVETNQQRNPKILG